MYTTEASVSHEIPAEPLSRHDSRRLVPLTGATPAELGGLAHAALAWLEHHSAGEAWPALARTLADRAAVRPWPYRAVAVAGSADELRDCLRAVVSEGLHAGPAPRSGGQFTGRLAPATTPPGAIAFVVAGGGAHWPGMGLALYARDAVFRAAIDECGAAFAPHVAWSLLDELGAPRERSRLGEIEVGLMSSLAIAVALDRMLRAWGIVPAAVAGHSLGEAVAACLAGALTLEQAIQVVLAWCDAPRVVTTQGDLLAVKLPAAEAAAVLDGQRGTVAIAAINSPRSTTLAGDLDALHAIESQLTGRGVLCRKLRIGTAYHSPVIEPLRGPLLARLSGIVPRPPAIAFHTTAHEHAGAPRLDAMHWWNSLRGTVHLASAIGRMDDSGCRVFWELAPHPVLCSAISECLEARSHHGVVLGTLRRGDDVAGLLGSAGAHYAAGGTLDWPAVHRDDRDDRHDRVELPPLEPRELRAAATSDRAPVALPHDDPATWRGALLPRVIAAAAEIMGRAPGDIASTGSWLDAGLESLHAIKLRAALHRQFAVEIPLARLFSGESIAELVADLEDQLARRDPAPGHAAELDSSDVGELPAHAVDALLAQLIESCPPAELAALLDKVRGAS
jgi:acyl transferase domain-containing protein